MKRPTLRSPLRARGDRTPGVATLGGVQADHCDQFGHGTNFTPVPPFHQWLLPRPLGGREATGTGHICRRLRTPPAARSRRATGQIIWLGDAQYGMRSAIALADGEVA